MTLALDQHTDTVHVTRQLDYRPHHTLDGVTRHVDGELVDTAGATRQLDVVSYDDADTPAAYRSVAQHVWAHGQVLSLRTDLTQPPTLVVPVNTLGRNVLSEATRRFVQDLCVDVVLDA